MPNGAKPPLLAKTALTINKLTFDKKSAWMLCRFTGARLPLEIAALSG